MPLLILSSLALVIAFIILYWLHNQWQLDIVVEPVSAPEIAAPRISVIVPARNEERNIGRCVESLLAQTYPNFEVIILDDRSTDATSEILRRYQENDSRLKVVHGVEPPAGWAGKPHALVQAAGHADGEWVCFIDADTYVTGDALASVYRKAIETSADLFTIMNDQIMLTFWEKTVMPLVFTGLSAGFSPRRVNDPKRKDAIANGQFIFIKRSVYDAVGGHAAIKGSIVEDKEMAELVKGSGFRLIVADGRFVAKTRMYANFPDMWEGWTKNIYLGLKDSISLSLLGVFGAFLALMATLFMPVWAFFGLGWIIVGGGWMAWLVLGESFIVWTYMLYLRASAARRMHISGWYSLTTPLGAAVFGAMMFASAWKVISGRGVTWKGRTYNSKR